MSHRRSRSKSPRRRRSEGSSPSRRRSGHERDRERGRESEKRRERRLSSPRARREDSRHERRDERKVDWREKDERRQRWKGERMELGSVVQSPWGWRERERGRRVERERERDGKEGREKEGKEEREREGKEEREREGKEREKGGREGEEEGQENQRTDRFKSERFDDTGTVEGLGGGADFLKGRGHERRWIEGGRGRGRGRGRGGWGGPRDFNWPRGRGGFRGGFREGGGGWEEPSQSQRLFQSLTDPRDVPRAGWFFEHDDRDAPSPWRRPMAPRGDSGDPRRPRRYSSEEGYGEQLMQGWFHSDNSRWGREREREGEWGRPRREREREGEWGRPRREREGEWGRPRREREREGEWGRKERRWGGSPDRWEHDLFDMLEENSPSPEGQEEEEEDEGQKWRSVVQKAPSIDTKWAHDELTPSESGTKEQSDNTAMDTGTQLVNVEV